MKKLFLQLSLLFCTVNAFAIDGTSSFAVFKGPDNQSVLEVYIYMVGTTLEPKISDQGLQLATKGTINFYQGGELMLSDSIRSISTNYASKADILDMVELQRYALKPGTYLLEVRIEDANQPGNMLSSSTFVTLESYGNTSLQMSDIAAMSDVSKDDGVSRFHRNGYLMIPKALYFYPKFQNTLTFYAEIYNANTVGQDQFLMRYFIRKVGGGDAAYGDFKFFRKKQAQPLIAIIEQVDITKLPSGTWELVLELADKTNKPLGQRVFTFQRSNPVQDEALKDFARKDISTSFVDTLNEANLDYCLKALRPMVDNAEATLLANVVKQTDPMVKRQFLLTYWEQRDPLFPVQAFNDYMKVARYVDFQFRTASYRGFDTERGRVYLRYGPPNNISVVDNEFGKIPYQIWEYDSFSEFQSRVIYVFYNPSLVPGDFQILHSTARGENSNPNWKLEINRNEYGAGPRGSTMGRERDPSRLTDDSWAD